MSGFLKNLPVPKEVRDALVIEIKDPDDEFPPGHTQALVITRDAEERVETFKCGSSNAWVITRDGNGRISSLTNGIYLRTINRDLNNRIQSISVVSVL